MCIVFVAMMIRTECGYHFLYSKSSIFYLYFYSVFTKESFISITDVLLESPAIVITPSIAMYTSSTHGSTGMWGKTSGRRKRVRSKS